MQAIGLGPHGERPFPADKLVLSDPEAESARAGRFAMAVVLHTTTSDWSRQELAGIVATLEHHDATIFEIVDCRFDKDRQNKELLRLANAPIHAVRSIEIKHAAAAYMRITQTLKTIPAKSCRVLRDSLRSRTH